MKCSKCKEELIENAKYCHVCGTIILRKISFIANGKKKKNPLNIIIDELEKSKEEIEELKKKVKTLEEKEIFPVLGGQGTIPWTQPGPTITYPGDTITVPNTGDITFYTGSGTGNMNLTSDDSTSITSNSCTFTCSNDIDINTNS